MQKNQLSEQTMGKIRLALLVAIVTLAVGIFMYYFTFTSYGYSNWTFVIMNIILFSVFFLLSSFRKKLNRLPNSVYIAFIVALFAEMYGIPLTMYFFAWIVRLQPYLQHRVSPNPSIWTTSLLRRLPLLGLSRIKNNNRRRHSSGNFRLVPDLPS